MTHPSTLRALESRAKDAAGWLDYWKKKLVEKVKEQDIELWDYSDDDLPITFKRGDIRNLIEGMAEKVGELRRFSN